MTEKVYDKNKLLAFDNFIAREYKDDYFLSTTLVQIAVGVSIRDDLRKLNCCERWRGILHQSVQIQLYYEILSQADGFHHIFRRAHVPDKHGRDR